MLSAVLERPKIADAALSVVLFAPVGGTDLEAVVRTWLAWLDQRPGAAELLLILDGAGAERELHLDDPRLRIIHHVAPSGLGACLQTAIWLARHPLLLTSFADRQFQPADAERLFQHIDQVDIVSGSRVPGLPPLWLRGLGVVKRVLTRVLLGYAGEPRAAWLGWPGWWRRFWIRIIFGLKMRDTQSMFRLCRAEAMQRFPIQARGSFALVEVLAKANHLVGLLAEAPVPWTPPILEEPDAFWSADAATVRRDPDFG